MCALAERNERDVINADPKEPMRGLSQVIRVINYPATSEEGHRDDPEIPPPPHEDTDKQIMFLSTTLVLFYCPF